MFSEKTFKSIFNNAVDGILVVDVEQKSIILANKVFCEMIGYSEEEVKKLSIQDLHCEEDLIYAVTQFNAQAEGKLPIARDLPFLRKNNSIIYVDINAIETYYENKKHLIAILRDVTDRRDIVDELLFKTTLLETQLETTIDGILVVDDKSNILLYNQRFADMWNIPKPLLDAKNDNEVLQYGANLITDPGEFKRKVIDLYFHKEQKSRDEIEFKDGRVFDRYSSPLISKKGRYFGRIWYFRDISDYKRAELALRKSEETFRLVTEVTNDALWDWNIATNEVYRNPRHATMLGYKPEELSNSQEEWETRIHPDDKSRVIKILDDNINKKSDTFEIEYRLRKKAGDYIWVFGRGKIVGYDEKDRPLRMIGTNIDITERKEIQTALQESEERYRTIVESSIIDVVILSDEGKVEFMNTRAAVRFNAKPAEIIGKTIWDISSKEFADNFFEIVCDIIKNDYAKTMEIETDIQGVHACHETYFQPLKINGKPTRSVMIIAREITEHKKADKALLASEDRYRALIESTGETIAIIDQNGIFLYMNTIAAERLGGKTDDYVGKTMWDLFPKDIADRQIVAIKHVIQTRQGMTKISQSEVQGIIRWYETTITPLEKNNGSAPIAIIYARDITEKKKTQEELDTYREEIAHAERLASLGTLSATAAHELTQPLTVIRLLIENAMTKLQNTSSPEAVVDKLRESLTEISNITSVVDRLRNFARKSTEIALKDIDLKTIAHRIVNLLRESSLHPKVEMIIKDMDELPCIYSNEKDLEQLFFALLDNAIHAAGNKKDRQIIISGIDYDDYVELRIADNCSGIAPENIERIFEPFFTTKPANQGTGLGLCIVRDIVSRIGGKISVESELGEGATFFVKIPLNNDMK
ncbi:MAG: PAS domain S-box protein [Sedimentisphaerales bacterium]|nr:PAS domain S-box protein [Sedimentisphaerales bacterium]